MTVYLVGAGPGDPGLLTVRGAEVLSRADVIVYDRLSVASLLDLAPAGAERISVGKAPGHPSVDQADINALLVERGKAGQEVVRLKGGDPFVFARGGEEAQALADAGVPFEVVPGITSAVAVPAYAGIPVTMRHSSTSFTVVTGHEDPSKADELDWDAVARVGGTIVVLMGAARIAPIVERLVAAGLDPSTPAAAIQWGTRPQQRTVRATLATLPDQVVRPPSTIVIGKVAGLQLDWFESRPLFGRRVVVTRARSQASELVVELHRLGAEPIELPAIVIQDAGDGGAALADAARRTGEFDWVTFTSANAVERFFAHLRDARGLGGVRVAAIGPGTADALAARGVVADLVPERFVAESLVEALTALPPGRLLLPRAAVARDVLPDSLRRAGWDVEVVEAYRTAVATPSPEALDAARTADAIAFTSSSTVTNYLASAGADAVPPFVACIGPVTAETARRHGIDVDVVAEVHTIAGLLDALVAGLGGVTVRALVFDFDGLIVDTESSEFETVREVYEEHGAPLTLAMWQHRIGTQSRHWLDELEDIVGPVEDRTAVLDRRRERHLALIAAQAVLPGVEALIGEALEAGVALAVASSSSGDWVHQHLERLGLLDRFACVRCCGDGLPAKPAPDLYLAACRELAVAPHEAVALEDSPHGVRSAKAAGLWCVAVPGPLTSDLDFAGADLVVESLADLPLRRLSALASGQ